MASDQGAKVYRMVAFSFEGEKKAAEVYKQMEDAQFWAGYEVVAHAIVEVNEKGKVEVHQPGRGGVGATIGALTGGLLALIGGPAGLIVWALAGGAIGGVAGHFVGRQFDQDELKKLGTAMKPNSSGVIAIVEDTAVEKLVNAGTDYTGTIYTLTIGDEASGAIAEYVAAEPAGGADS